MPTKRAALADVHAPSVALPMSFILTGVAALLAGSVWLVVRPDLLATYHYNQTIIAATHLFVLGWLCTVTMGAIYQLVPVALETRLFSERLAWVHLALHLAGFVGMVLMFRVWNLQQVGHFGAVLTLGVILFVYNLGRTLARIPCWNVIAAGITSSLAWLFLTVLAGLFVTVTKVMGTNLFDPMAQMHAHAHLGGLGFFILMIVAVSFRVVPLFTLSEIQNARRAGGALALLNGGLAGLFAGMLLGRPWKILFAGVVLAGLALYGWEMIAILRARKRSSFDWGLKHFLTALAVLVPVSLLGFALAWPNLPLTALTAQLENAYGFLAFIGVVTFAIMGMLYKIVPFLVWYASYSKAIGRHKVPALAELYSQTLQAVAFWLMVSALVVTTVATALGHETAVRAGCALLLASVIVFAVNLGRILGHLVRPRLEPLVLKPAAAKPA